jgi:transposase
MARSDRDLGKEQFWRGVLRRWQGSKLTVGQFCAGHGVSVASFYSWRRIIAERDRQARQPSDSTAAGDRPVFVPLSVTPALPNPTLEVVAGSGRIVRIPPGFDADTLRRLLAVLEEASPC